MNFKPGAAGELLKLIFPQFYPIAVAASAVTGYVKPCGIGIRVFSDRFPPTRNALDRKLCRIMTCAYIYKTCVGIEIINAIRRDFPEFLDREVMIKNLARVFDGAVFPALVLEISDVFFLLRIVTPYTKC